MIIQEEIQLKTGDIVLISGKSDQAKAIQKFQQLEDIDSAKWNHSGLIYRTPHNIYVTEASYIQQRKVKAAVVMTPIEDYMKSDCEILILQHDFEGIESLLEKEIMKYVGTPYEYTNLTAHQIFLKLTKIWIGRNKHADKRFICHEYTMTVWNNIACIFNDCRKGQVMNIFNNKHFKHLKLK